MIYLVANDGYSLNVAVFSIMGKLPGKNKTMICRAYPCGCRAGSGHASSGLPRAVMLKPPST